jgi:endonuclease/exonuclease/phosphatase (EEP) superfamily protein YafD
LARPCAKLFDVPGGLNLSQSGAWKRRLARVLSAASWFGCAVCAWIVASSRLGIIRPYATVALQAFGIWMLGTAWVALASAIVLRRRLLGTVAAVLCVAHLVIVLPLARRDAPAPWARTAPSITLLAANVLVDNDRYADVARTITQTNADIVVLSEVSYEWLLGLRTNGALDAYPHQVLNAYSGAGIGSIVMSKLPIVAEHTDYAARRAVHSIDVMVGSTKTRIVAVHPQSPNTASLVSSWRDQVAGLVDMSRKRTTPIVFAGDLNSSYLNPPYRDLIATGLRDAHEARGIGFTNSFPMDKGPLPWTRLDHALVSDEIDVLSVAEVVVPGSDHRGFVTKLAVKQN